MKRALCMGMLVWPLLANAMDADWQGLLDMRLLESNSSHDWLHGGLDKQRFDRDHAGLQVGQAVLDGRMNVLDTVQVHAWLNAYEQREHVVGLGEAYLQWKPVPRSAWRWRTRAGLFFPPVSLENEGLGWTSTYLISSSALNNWVGEELRTLGLESSVQYGGALVGSAHDWRLTAGLFGWNDPAGGLLAWRGWTVGDRVSASWEQVPFPALPIFDPVTGYWRGQMPALDPFRELDGRAGYYVGGEYRYLDRWRLSVLHYDNRGDPTVVAGGQWAWDTRFNHVGMRWQGPHDLTLLAQWLQGQTIMGYVPVHDLIADFHAAYLLLSQQYGAQQISLRYDRFAVRDLDGKAADPNAESGWALAAGWRWRWHAHADLALEGLQQDSRRQARLLLAGPEQRRETLWQASVRTWF